MPIVVYGNTAFEVDDDGYLLDPSKWNEEWVNHSMRKVGVCVLSEEHHKLIQALREYYEKHKKTPTIKDFSKATKFTLITSYRLFDFGPSGASLVAGIPKPPVCP